MKKITQIYGKTMPLVLADVDTDLIIPAQYLTSTSRQGYGKYLFNRLRQDPNFILNQPQFEDATILLTTENFGCGSSREHAVWALLEAGIQAILATSFADIFFNNSSKNGLLLIELPKIIVDKILNFSLMGNYFLKINLAEQKIISEHHEPIDFAIDPFRKYCLTNGIDELDYIMQNLPSHDGSDITMENNELLFSHREPKKAK